MYSQPSVSLRYMYRCLSLKEQLLCKVVAREKLLPRNYSLKVIFVEQCMGSFIGKVHLCLTTVRKF